MNLKCLFKGHNMHEGSCTQCLKTECEIKGHEWIYSDFWVRKWNDGHKCEYSKKRICIRCGDVEKLCEGIFNDEWVRVSVK